MYYSTGTKIFWREKETKRWNTGWICDGDSQMVLIGPHNGALTGHWYDRDDIEIKTRNRV